MQLQGEPLERRKLRVVAISKVFGNLFTGKHVKTQSGTNHLLSRQRFSA
jgi:hypothetical protein